MASPNLYVRSTDGSDSDNGTTWALAKATVAGAAAIDSTTDNRIWVSDAHNESNAAAQTWAFAGTQAAPTWLVAGDDAAEPPIAVSTATCTTTGAFGFVITGNVYGYGLTLNCGSGVVNNDIAFATTAGDWQMWENCTFNIVGTGGTATITIGTAGNYQPASVNWKNVTVSFGDESQGILLGMGAFTWDGGSIASMAFDLVSGLIQPSETGEYTPARISGVDLAEVGVTGFLIKKTTGCIVDAVFRDCKIPAFTTGGIVNGTLVAGDRVEMYNCDSADTNYRLWVEDYFGDITSDTSIYNDTGADDGSAQGFSWKMVSSANTEFPHQVLVTPEIVKWNDTTTGTLTATVEIVHESQGSGTNGVLLDSEIWLEVMCMDPGGTPVGKWQSDQCANLNLNGNAAAQATSSVAWTGDAAGWDTQKLVVSFTPKEKGYVHARVCLALASKTVYVDPLLTIA